MLAGPVSGKGEARLAVQCQGKVRPGWRFCECDNVFGVLTMIARWSQAGSGIEGEMRDAVLSAPSPREFGGVVLPGEGLNRGTSRKCPGSHLNPPLVTFIVLLPWRIVDPVLTALQSL